MYSKRNVLWHLKRNSESFCVRVFKTLRSCHPRLTPKADPSMHTHRDIEKTLGQAAQFNI